MLKSCYIRQRAVVAAYMVMLHQMVDLRGVQKVGDVGAKRKVNAQFVRMSGVLVILCDTFPNLSRRDPHNWIGIGVVVAPPCKDIDAKSSLF